MILGEQNSKKLLRYIEFFFLVFILLQPFLDLVAFVGSSLSLVVRVFAMGIGFLYLILYPSKKLRKYAVIYLIVLGLFILLNTINNYFVKDPFKIVQEATIGIKSFYVIEMILVYIAVFLSLKKRMDWEKVVNKYIFINMSVIGIIMILANVFESGKRSYGIPQKLGHSGWFYSANELSAILALGLGIMIICFINNKSLKGKLIQTPFILIVVWSLLTIGTRVGLGAALMLVASGALISFVLTLMKKGKKITFGLISFIFILSVIYTPYSAVGHNLGLPFLSELVSSDQENIDSSANKDTEELNKTQEELNNENDFEKDEQNVDKETNEIFSKETLNGREQFMSRTIEDYKEAPLTQKILGMGPGGNYENRLKLIEMDFVDWFFSYGVIGTALLLLPILLALVIILKRLVKFPLNLISPTFLIIGLEIGLGIGIALFAGHVFLNPASGFYFSILLSYLFIYTLESTSKKST